MKVKTKKRFEDTVIDIILAKGGKINASELEKEAMEQIGVVRSTFYRRLPKLIDKGLVLKQAEGRNVIYRVNYQRIPKERLVLPSLKLEVLSLVNEALKPFEKSFMRGEINDARFLRELGDQIAKISLWALLKQIETGEPFIDVASFYLSYIGGAQMLLKRTMWHKEAIDIDLQKQIALSDPRVAFKDLPDFQPALDRYEKALKSLYPKNGIEELEARYAEASEGKSSFQIQKGE